MISPQKSTTVSAIKGHMVPKSSALTATGNCKLEKQFLTAQNMASHYKRVINAKPTIDISPPKSMITSQKARDRAKREMLSCSTTSQSIQRTKSADPLKSTSSVDIQESKFTMTAPTSSITTRIEDMKPRALPSREKINKEMSDMMANFTKKSSNRTMLYKPKPETDDLAKSQKMESPVHTTRNVEEKTKNAFSDLLHTSRSNNNPMMTHPALKAMSRLVAGHNYDILDNHAEKFKQPQKEFEPRIKNKENASSKLLETNNCYQPPRRRKKNGSAQNSARESVVSENLDVRESYEEVKETNQFKKNFNQNNNTLPLNASVGLNESNNFMNTSRQLETSQTSLKRAAEQEEELKYLEFIKEVTDDIISRGISSNRVINNCFNYHIKKNKHLSERKMKELLNTLRQDLDIPNDDGEVDVNPAYHQTVNKAILLDKERNKENLIDNGAHYLTLKKFGWTATSSNNANNNFNAAGSSSPTKNVWKMIDDEEVNDYRVKPNSAPRQFSNSDKNKTLFDEYETQIIKNIQSIRRSSIGNGNEIQNKINETYDQILNPKANNLENKAQPGSRRGSNQSLGGEFAAKEGSFSKDTLNNAFANNSSTNRTLTNNQIEQHEDDADDDDDIYIPKPRAGSHAEQLNISNSNSKLNTSNAKMNTSYTKTTNLNDSRANVETHNESIANNQINTSQNNNFAATNNPTTSNNNQYKSEYSEDILFNDDYGEPEPEDQDGNDDDNFENLLKTKSFKKSEIKTENQNDNNYDLDDNEDDEESELKNLKSDSPKPAARSKFDRYQNDDSDEDGNDDDDMF